MGNSTGKLQIDTAKLKELRVEEENERLRSTLLNVASVIENVLGNLERDLWRIPEPTRSTAVGILTAVVEECRGIVGEQTAGKEQQHD